MYRITIALALSVLPLVLNGQPSPQAAKPPVVDSAFITALVGGDHAWFTSQVSRGSRAVRIENVDNASECERRVVEFTPLTNAPPPQAPPPITAKGIWFRPPVQATQDPDTAYLSQNPTLTRGATGRGNNDPAYLARWQRPYCYTSIRWRLSDNPGHNVLRARLLRKDTVQVTDSAAFHTTVEFRAIGHAPPGIIVGLAYLPGGVTGIRVPSGPDSAKEVSRKAREIQPFIGIDFPIVVSFLSEGAQHVLGHLRPVIATSYGDPGFDVYAGLEILPGLYGARALANPFQISIGHRFGIHSDSNDYFVAAHFNASGAIGSFLGGLGAGK